MNEHTNLQSATMEAAIDGNTQEPGPDPPTTPSTIARIDRVEPEDVNNNMITDHDHMLMCNFLNACNSYCHAVTVAPNLIAGLRKPAPSGFKPDPNPDPVPISAKLSDLKISDKFNIMQRSFLAITNNP